MAASDAGRVMLGIVRQHAFWSSAASAIVINRVSYFLADWIPLYLKPERGFSFSAARLHAHTEGDCPGVC